MNPADFVFDSGPSNAEKERKAKLVCATCPVQRPCLEYALENVSDPGVWGMTTLPERRKMRRRKRRDPELTTDQARGRACPTCKTRTPTVRTYRGQVECMDCGARWVDLAAGAEGG